MVTSIEIDAALKSRIENLANLRQKSADWVMREAIAQYVDREEARESFKQEAMESWADYQRTGLHLTGEEVSAWLKTWGTEADSEPPECHE
jgi:predicted transcriptional regulator